MAVINNETLSALNTSVDLTFNNALNSISPEYEKIATKITSTTASNTYAWLGEMPQLVEWIGQRAIKDIQRYSYTIENKLFESSVGVKRTDIEDDNLGTYTPMFESLGRCAAEHPNKMVFELLVNGEKNNCYDGKKFFATNHPVYEKSDGTGKKTEVANFVAGESAPWVLLDTAQPLKPLIFQQRTEPELTKVENLNNETVFMLDQYRYGVRARHNVGYGFWQMAYMSKQELNAENFNAAVAAMMSQTADGGRVLGIKPTFLVVPPSLRAKAFEIAKAARLSDGSDNINQGLVEVIVSPYMVVAK